MKKHGYWLLLACTLLAAPAVWVVGGAVPERPSAAAVVNNKADMAKSKLAADLRALDIFTEKQIQTAVPVIIACDKKLEEMKESCEIRVHRILRN